MNQKLTREEAVEIAGEELITAVEETNCEHTNSVTDGTELSGYTLFSAVSENDTHKVTMYYIEDNDDVNSVDSLDQLSFSNSHFEVEEI